jgi:hypothetical protein
VDTQKIDAPKAKTHEEILKIFKDVQSAEARVKNPGEMTKASYEQLTILRQEKPVVKEPEESPEVTQPIEPQREIPVPEQNKPKRLFLKRIKKPEKPSEKKTKLFDFIKIEVTEDEDLTSTLEIEQQPEDITIRPSTFVLQLDTNGNLVGFPMKITHEHKKSEQSEASEGEPEKGIKGKLKRLGSKFRRKKSEDSESSGGIADKIKGIFKRRNKE